MNSVISTKTKLTILLINISFNVFNKQDVPSVLAIECLTYPTPWTETQFVDSLNNPQTLACLVRVNQKIVGYTLALHSVDSADLLNICIHPKYQHQGLGKALFNHVLQQLQHNRISTIFLEVRQSNQPAFLFYQMLGFKVIETRKKYYSNGEDAKIMRFKRTVET